MEELLSPYRILDLTDRKGMLCGRILSDMGADVIKVEPPKGDDARGVGPFLNDDPDPEKSLFWFFFNANKRGITLTLDTDDGKEVFRELISKVDILLESYEPGYMESQGLGYDELSKVNPKLIMTRISPFGQNGPKAHYKTTELIRWASGGVMHCTGYPDRAPVGIALPQDFIHAGIEAAFVSLVALWHCAASGEGQEIDVSIQASAIDSTLDTPERWIAEGRELTRSGSADCFSPEGVKQKMSLPCKDGTICIYMLGGGLLASADHLNRLRKWMKEEDMAPDWFMEIDWVRDYASSEVTQDFVDLVESTIEAFTITKTKAELFKRALKDRLIMAPVQDPKDMWENEQLRERNFWKEIEHKHLGRKINYAGPFALFSETPLKLKRPAPRIGEHNEEIYMGDFDISEERFSLLRKIGAI